MFMEPGMPFLRTRYKAILLAVVMSVACGRPIAAQQQGPLPPPPSSGSQNSPAPAPTTGAAPAAAAQEGAAKTSAPAISNAPPALPVDQIIQKFAAREEEFKKERDNYTYTQTFVIQTIDSDGIADGEYQMRSDILFTPDGSATRK